MARLRYWLFAAVFALASVAVFLVIAVAELLSRGAIARLAPPWSAMFRFLARHMLGIRLRVLGVVPAGAVIVAGKHQSVYEALGLLDILANPAVVLKAELLAVPFWRWFARANGAIPVNRAASAASIRTMLRGGKAASAAGRTILVFPEGTRVRPGEAPPLRAGITALYERLRLPVTPLALDSGLCWPDDGRPPMPGTITMRFLPPIPPGLPRAEFEARLHAAINTQPA